jgi:hypothetical protein
MHDSYEVTVLTTHVIGTPLEIDIGKLAGIISLVEIFFPKGCARTIRASLFDTDGQISPLTAASFYSLDGKEVSIPLYYVNVPGEHSLHIKAWTIGSSYSHTLTVHVECKPFDSPDGGN